MKKIILISEGKISLAPGVFFPISITTFPKGSITFRARTHQYWEVEATGANGELTFAVTNYHPTDTSGFAEQRMKNIVESIHFTGLDWQELELLLASYKLKDLRPFLEPSNILPKLVPVSDGVTQQRFDFVIAPDSLEEREITYEEDFQISYEKASFRDGYVEFEKSFSWFPNALQIRIENTYIREEFDLIKNYFANAINKRKKFRVKVIAKKIGFSVAQHTATSEEIDKINADLIDGVRIATTRKLFGEHRKHTANKKVLSVDEIFENLEEYPNVFNQSDVEILEVLADAYGMRNKLPLRYLSGSLQSTKQKVKFTLKPLFGFLFFIEGVTHDFYCWELLNSNATYLWRTRKDMGHAVHSEVEAQISLIHEIGREQYRKSVKETPPKDLHFMFIDHKGINSEGVGFEIWKRRLSEVIN